MGYLANVKTTTVEDLDDNKYTALLCYFYTDEGTWFKAYYRYDPYFYIAIHPDFKEDFLGFLEKNYKVYFKNVEEVKKINLEEISHMAGDRATYFKISFDTIPVDSRVLTLESGLAEEEVHDRVRETEETKDRTQH